MTAHDVIARVVRDIDRERFATLEDRADAFAAAIIIALNEAGYIIEAAPRTPASSGGMHLSNDSPFDFSSRHGGYRAGGPND